MSEPGECSRRLALWLLGAGSVGAWLGACGDGALDGVSDAVEVFEAPWFSVELTEYPALLDVGGWAFISRPDVLFEGIVVCVAPGRYVAAWRICTHGACGLEVELEAGAVRDVVYVCPCHGSRFGVGGEVLVGPATVALRVFEVVRRDALLWINRG